MPIRESFPEAGSEYLGGKSDGWEYQTAFSSTTLAQTYEMVRLFLEEEGYGDIPIPANAKELALFKKPEKNGQFALFREEGYVHNPIKIIFPPGKRKSFKLVLYLYNEQTSKHLLRFHKII